jgi:hypothetical protein
MATRRIELGFEGGTVLRLTVDEALSSTLTNDLGGGGWTSLEAEEGTFWVNLGEVVDVRLPPGQAPGRVGFGGS